MGTMGPEGEPHQGQGPGITLVIPPPPAVPPSSLTQSTLSPTPSKPSLHGDALTKKPGQSPNHRPLLGQPVPMAGLCLWWPQGTNSPNRDQERLVLSPRPG